MNTLEIPNSRKVGDITILQLTGTVVRGPKVDAIHAAIDTIEARGGSLVLDLSSVDKIDSAALGEMVSAYTKLEGAVGLYGVKKRIKDLFARTKLSGVLPVYSDEADATKNTPARASKQSSPVANGSTSDATTQTLEL